MQLFTSLDISKNRSRFVAALAAIALTALSMGAGVATASASPAGPTPTVTASSDDCDSSDSGPSSVSGQSGSSSDSNCCDSSNSGPSSVSGQSGSSSSSDPCCYTGSGSDSGPSSVSGQSGSSSSDPCCYTGSNTGPSSVGISSPRGPKSNNDCCYVSSSSISTLSKKKEEDSKKGKKAKKAKKPEGYDCCVVSSISPSSSGEKGKKGKKGKKDKRGKCIVPDYSLSIEKEQRQDNPVAVGSTVNYDLTVSNGGTTTAPKGFVVSDPIPTWLTYVSASGSGFSCTHVVLYDEVRCTATADLAKNASRVITVTVTVDADAGNADSVVNTACLEDSSDGKVLASGCSSVTTEFPEGGFTLTKTNNPVEAIQLDGFGSTITYTLTASATGALDQTNVVVTDILPGYDPAHSSSARVNLADGVNSIVCKDSSSAVISPCGSYGSASHKVTAALGTITSGTSKTVEITVVVPIQTTATPPTTLEILNQGHAKSDLLGDDEDVDSETVRNVVAISGDNGTTRAICDVDTPEFDIAGAGFQEGDVVTMDIYDSNNTLVYTDYQPSNELAPVQQTADANGKVQFSGVWWPGFSNSPTKIYPGPLLLQIKVVLHKAHSPSTSLIDGGFAPSLWPALHDGHSTDPVTIDYPTSSRACTPVALDIVKSNNPASSTVITEFGAEITYTMDVTASEDNLVDSRSVTVSDVLPGYDTVTSGTATYKAGSAACDANIAALGSDSTCDVTLSNSNHTVTWELGVLRPGDTRQVSFVVTVDVQGTNANPASFTLKNQASLDTADTDPQGSNVVENPVVVPLRAEISVVKKASISEANPNNKFFKTVARARGKIVTYRYVVSNTGTLPVSNIKLVDDLTFGPRYGSAVQSTPNESNLFDCRVGDDVGAAPSYGETQSFNLGQAIGNSSVLTLQPGKDMYLYCDFRVPTSLTDAQIARNDLYDKATVSGSSATGAVAAVSNIVVVDLVKVDSDLVVFKNITDEDGTNYRKYEVLGRLEVPTLKTYRMFVDNVSTSPQRVQVYDYFLNTSRGLSEAQRDAIFRSMTCINYNADSGFKEFPNPVPVLPKPDGAFLSAAQDVTFGEATGGGGAGTFLARYQDIGTLLPEEGWNFVCQALLPPGEYDLTNIFRVISTPILEPTALSGSGVVRTNAVPAVTGKQDISTASGVETSTPFEEGGGSGGGVSEESGSPLANTGADLVLPTAILGMLLVGLGIGARRLGRATR